MLQMPARTLRSALTLDGISHSYGSGLAVDNVTLEVRDGELISLVGPSGCGKSTLLRIIAGFVRQTAGRVIIGDAAIDDLPPEQREVFDCLYYQGLSQEQVAGHLGVSEPTVKRRWRSAKLNLARLLRGEAPRS